MKNTRLSNLIAIIMLNAYTLYMLFSGQANLFFIIYLFFLDEVIRNIFLKIKVIGLRKYAIDIADINEILKTRFFMLFIYSIFIIVVFGFFYGLTQLKMEEFIRNVQIFFFKDVYFNISVAIILIREGFSLFYDLKYAKAAALKHINIFTGSIFTLHLSIILGGLLWGITSGSVEGWYFNFGAYNHLAIIFPFLVVKLGFDLYAVLKKKELEPVTTMLKKS